MTDRRHSPGTAKPSRFGRPRERRTLSSGADSASGPRANTASARRRPNRLGFAVPDEWRLSVTEYPGIRPGDAQETLLHELVHLHVGRQRGHHAWHGPLFKQTLARAMAEAYGIDDLKPRSTLHGAYAAALELRRLTRGEQLALELAA